MYVPAMKALGDGWWGLLHSENNSYSTSIENSKLHSVLHVVKSNYCGARIIILLQPNSKSFDLSFGFLLYRLGETKEELSSHERLAAV